MDKSLLMYRGGVRSVTKQLADGNEHQIFYKARTPSEIAGFRGAVSSFASDEKGQVARDKYMGRFLSSALVNEDGSQLLTVAESDNVPDTLKLELCLLVIAGSTETGDAGNG